MVDAFSAHRELVMGETLAVSAQALLGKGIRSRWRSTGRSGDGQWI